ncbi:MAG: hypothetical protein LDL11_05445 [Desulfarculus sp.]|nr:hypothetical protein [Desulfarculus sp.]
MSCAAARQAQLLAQGWVKQFTADEPRLSEAVEEYRELGFEVHLEPLDPTACATADGCAACLADPDLAARFRVIFTRRLAPPARDDD